MDINDNSLDEFYIPISMAISRRQLEEFGLVAGDLTDEQMRQLCNYFSLCEDAGDTLPYPLDEYDVREVSAATGIPLFAKEPEGRA